MVVRNTLQMITTIPKFNGSNFVEWTRSFNDILQIPWPFLSKIVSGLERSESILREKGEREENTGDFDGND